MVGALLLHPVQQVHPVHTTHPVHLQQRYWRGR